MRAYRIATGAKLELFGDSVGGALETLVAEREKRKQGRPSELMDLLIAYDWNQSFALGAKSAEVSLP